MTDLKPVLAKLATGAKLDRGEAEAAFEIIMTGDATPSQIGAFLMALRVRGETVDEITGRGADHARQGQLASRRRPARSTSSAPAATPRARYNISTGAALVVAGARRAGRQARQPRAVLEVRRGRRAGGARRQHRGRHRRLIAR